MPHRALTLLALLSGCPRPTCPVCDAPVPEDTDPTPETDTDPPAPPDACPADVMVGFVPSGPCADALTPTERDAWTATPLFLGDDPTPDALEWFSTLPPDLRGYCVFVRQDPTAPPLPASVAHPDCPVVAPLGAVEVSADLHAPLRDAFLTAAEAGHAIPVQPAPVWVQVIDTAVDAAPGVAVDPTDDARHGCIVATLVHDLTCAAADACAAEVGTLLALDRVPGSALPSPTGGFYGRQSTLAKRVVDAVRLWRTGGPERLVINLSVGWDGRYNSPPGQPGTLSWPARAVRDALEDAACRGVLTIAAAGNDAGGPTPSTGPMYPAAWEDRPLPTRCAGLAGSATVTPILHAAAGLAANGATLLSTLPDGLPRLVAPAFHARGDVATWAPSCGAGGAQDASLTGSSVAAAVTTAAAAAAWALAPDLTPSELGALLHATGTVPTGDAPPGGWTATFGATPRAPVRRVSVCGAVQAVCASGPCPPPCPAPGPWRTDVPYTPTPVDRTFDASGLTLLAPDDCAGACPHDTWPNLFALPDAVLPLPTTDPCSECWLERAGGRLHLALNPALGGPLLDARLVWFGDQGERLGVIALSDAKRGEETLGAGLRAGEVLGVTDLPDPPTDGKRARLEWRMRRGSFTYSVTSEIRIQP